MTTDMKVPKNVLVFLLSSLGLIVFPHVYHLPASLFGFFYLLLGWRFTGIKKPEWLPGKLTVSLITVLGIALLYHQHQGILGRDAGTGLFVTALGLKLLEIRSERDIYLINFLAFIVAASQFLFEQSILMAAYILFVCCVLLATLFSINCHNQQTASALKYAGTLIVQALPIGIALFVLFPRVNAPHWMMFDEHQAKSGLSDVMEPGSISNMASSDELVFRVKFSGPLPPPQQRYWRGPALTQTDGKRWTQAGHAAFQPLSPAPKFSGQAYHYTLLMEPQNKNWVYALDMAAEYAQPLQQAANYLLVTSEDPDKRSEYQLTSFPDYRTGGLLPWEYHETLQLPKTPSDKIKQFVDRLHGFDKPPETFIEQLLTHFRTENFRYTLTPPLLDEDPVETFLFETKQGFCSHYASAFVYLMRVAQIPARVVIGFQGGELNTAGNFLEVRQSDAHAWAEVWLKNRGWVRVDPTAAIAPERIEQSIASNQLAQGELIRYLAKDSSTSKALNWLKQARQLWGHVDYNWQRWVINYDNSNQSRFLSALGIQNMNTMIYWLIGISSLLIALLAWFLLYWKQRSTDRILLIYHRFCQKIGKRGLIREPAEGPKDFAERSKIAFPAHATAIDRITSAYIKLRYGKNTAAADVKDFNQLVSKFKI